MGALEGWGIIYILVVPILSIFILVRRFWLWYWKISERVRLLESIDEKLDVIIDIQSGNKPEV